MSTHRNCDQLVRQARDLAVDVACARRDVQGARAEFEAARAQYANTVVRELQRLEVAATAQSREAATNQNPPVRGHDLSAIYFGGPDDDGMNDDHSFSSAVVEVAAARSQFVPDNPAPVAATVPIWHTHSVAPTPATSSSSNKVKVVVPPPPRSFLYPPVPAMVSRASTPGGGSSSIILLRSSSSSAHPTTTRTSAVASGVGMPSAIMDRLRLTLASAPLTPVVSHAPAPAAAANASVRGATPRNQRYDGAGVRYSDLVDLDRFPDRETDGSGEWQDLTKLGSGDLTAMIRKRADSRGGGAV
ncbi:hypothetical protein BC828DRAFT_405842 [Blastocladiella britannica]|nr:hypothetical protein BC828DRAFT_405842 [Blastocladiella britannica]